MSQLIGAISTDAFSGSRNFLLPIDLRRIQQDVGAAEQPGAHAEEAAAARVMHHGRERTSGFLTKGPADGKVHTGLQSSLLSSAIARCTRSNATTAATAPSM
jgi:hypothetical protein